MYQHISSFYNQIFPKNNQLHQFILKYAKKGFNAIDLGCGTGRLVYDLYLNQMNVLGIDLDDSMIHYAKEAYPNLSFKTADMISALMDEKKYHLITCVGNTLPHLDYGALNMFLKLANQRLSNEGVMIIQLLNYDMILKNQPSELPLIKNNDFVFRRVYSYQKKHIEFKTILETSVGIDEDINILYPYQQKDLIQVFKKHRFSYEFYNEKLEIIKDLNHTHYTIVLNKQKDEN